HCKEELGGDLKRGTLREPDRNQQDQRSTQSGFSIADNVHFMLPRIYDFFVTRCSTCQYFLCM
ncbi:hypothetical protein ILYODFUR_038329, partial [Ilyodon furcidens]